MNERKRKKKQTNERKLIVISWLCSLIENENKPNRLSKFCEPFEFNVDHFEIEIVDLLNEMNSMIENGNDYPNGYDVCKQ